MMHGLPGTAEPESALGQVLTLNNGKKKEKVLGQEPSVNSSRIEPIDSNNYKIYSLYVKGGQKLMLLMVTHRGLNPENHSLEFEASLGYICVWDW